MKFPLVCCELLCILYDDVQTAGGGIITVNDPTLPGDRFAYTNSLVSPFTITLWGDNTIVGRYLLVANTATGAEFGIAGAGNRLMCGQIVAID